MSRSFLGIPFDPIQGLAPFLPASLCEPSNVPPAAIPYYIQWRTYNVGSVKPDMALNVNLQPATQTLQIDKIKSVYIDNLGCDVPVYVYFPSTGFTVPAQPNSASWYPVITSDWNAVIIGQGFTNASRNAETRVFFSNMGMAPYVSNELLQNVGLGLASSSVSRGGALQNLNYGAEALGDQFVQSQRPINAAGTTIALPARADGFYYIKSLRIDAWDLVSGVAGGATCTMLFNSFTAPGVGTIINLGFLVPEVRGPVGNVNLFYMSDMNLKYDARFDYNLVTTVGVGTGSGNAILSICYTTNPK